jgi:hypothetical protein
VGKGAVMTEPETHTLDAPGAAPLGYEPTVPTVHDEIAQGLKDHPAKKGMSFNVLVTLIEIGGSIGLFHLARQLGASDVVS